MKTIIEFQPNQTAEVELYFSVRFSNHGHWKVKCEISHEGDKTTISHTTTNSLAIDNINELRADNASHETIQQAIYDLAWNHIEERASEWLYFLINNK